MKKITCDGNEACARASYLFTEIAGIYPITPSSPMPELIDRWSGKGKKNIFGEIPKVIEMQSEAGAIGLVHGVLQTGVLATTYTASQGLLLMIPNMYKIAGEMWPFVMHVAARSLATHALSIFGDHQDVYATRSTGFCMMASSSVQDAYNLALVSHLSSIKASLPFLHFFDGFRTSHELNKISILEDEEVKELIPYEELEKFRKRALNNEHPVTRGTNQNGDIYFQETESRNKFYDVVSDIVNDYMTNINKLAGTNYKPFNYYGSLNAKKVIIAMGSVCETIKEVIDYLGDEIPSTPYFNDPGNNGQRNDAHIVEFIGALSILDFLQIPDDQLITSDGKAINPIYKEYGLAYDKKQISLMDLGMQSRLFINKQMIKFHIAYMYITNHLKKDIGHGYTLDKPEITNAFLSTSFYTTITANFYVAYNQWLKELKENQRSFVPFNLNTDNLKDCITDIQPKSGFLKSPLDYKKILSAMNSASQKAVKASRFGTNDVPQKLFCLLNETLDKLIEEKYISVI